MANKEAKANMSFMGHLEELRWMLVRSAAAVLISATVVFFFSDFVFDKIIFGPIDPKFFSYQLMCDISHYFGYENSICNTTFPFIIQNTNMEGQISILIWACITAGFIIAFPFILYLLWGFISPALYEKEKKNAIKFILISSVLFFLGVAFGYFIIVPMSINFFATFQVSAIVKNQFSVDSYISMVKTSVIACGLFFELPIIIYFLSKIGLVSPEFLRNSRKYSIVIILIVAAIVTPPDVISQIIVAIPMMIIYELSIFISVFVTKKQLKNE
jgi:sec-independent protein translocase protein TatC